MGDLVGIEVKTHPGASIEGVENNKSHHRRRSAQNEGGRARDGGEVIKRPPPDCPRSGKGRHESKLKLKEEERGGLRKFTTDI